MKNRIAMLLIFLVGIPVLYGQEEITGKKAPDFALKTMDGQTYRLSENLGENPIVINFWATWCIPCIEELKHMKKIQKNYSKKGVEFLAVSVDDTKTVGRVNSFAKSHNYPFTILLDTNSEVMHLYQSNVPPYTVIINASGNIVYTHLGYRMGDEKKVEQELEKLLKASSN